MTVTEEAQSGWFCKVSLIKISEVRHHAQILKNTQVHRKNKKKRNLLILLQRALLRKGESELQPYKTNTFKAPSTWKARVYLTELLFQDRACIFVMPSPFPSSFLLPSSTPDTQSLSFTTKSSQTRSPSLRTGQPSFTSLE